VSADMVVKTVPKPKLDLRLVALSVCWKSVVDISS
jgi:hypothetical protein